MNAPTSFSAALVFKNLRADSVGDAIVGALCALIEAIVGIGFRVLDDNERVSAGLRDFRRSITHGGRALDRVAGAETTKLDEQHRHQQEHSVRLRDALEQARKAARRVAFAGQIVPLPRNRRRKDDA